MKRVLFLIAVVGVAGCSDSPASLGITGPGAAPPAQPSIGDDSIVGDPGIPNYGQSYGPSIGPIPSSGRFFNYN
jgi:hypothetical protein